MYTCVLTINLGVWLYIELTSYRLGSEVDKKPDHSSSWPFTWIAKFIVGENFIEARIGTMAPLSLDNYNH